MKTTRCTVLSLLTCGALAFACADASDEAIVDESDDSASPAEQDAPPDPCGTEDDVASTEGYDLSTPEAALEAYARLREACKITAEVNRRGKPDTIEIQIK